MKICMESTDKITYLDGVQGRIWNGTTEDGTDCIVFVHRIAVANEKDASQFKREVKETLPPSRVFDDLRNVL